MGQVTLSTSEYKELVKAEEIVRQIREHLQFGNPPWDSSRLFVLIDPLPLLDLVKEEAAVAQIPLNTSGYAFGQSLSWDIVNNAELNKQLDKEIADETAGL